MTSPEWQCLSSVARLTPSALAGKEHDGGRDHAAHGNVFFFVTSVRGRWGFIAKHLVDREPVELVSFFGRKIVTQVAAGQDESLCSRCYRKRAMASPSSAHSSVRNMRERDWRESELTERPLQKRQLNFDAVLFGVGVGFALKKCHPRLEVFIQFLIDGYVAQRRVPTFPWAERRSMAARPVVNAD